MLKKKKPTQKAPSTSTLNTREMEKEILKQQRQKLSVVFLDADNYFVELAQMLAKTLVVYQPCSLPQKEHSKELLF